MERHFKYRVARLRGRSPSRVLEAACQSDSAHLRYPVHTSPSRMARPPQELVIPSDTSPPAGSFRRIRERRGHPATTYSLSFRLLKIRIRLFSLCYNMATTMSLVAHTGPSRHGCAGRTASTACLIRYQSETCSAVM